MEYRPHFRVFFGLGGAICIRGLCAYGGVYEDVEGEAEVACWGHDNLGGPCVIVRCCGGGGGGIGYSRSFQDPCAFFFVLLCHLV